MTQINRLLTIGILAFLLGMWASPDTKTVNFGGWILFFVMSFFYIFTLIVIIMEDK